MTEQPARRWYEYTIGLYIEAESEEDAWEQLQPLFRLARGLDAEGEESTELEGVWPVGGPILTETGTSYGCHV